MLALCTSPAACSNDITFKAKGQMQTGVSVSGHR